MPAAMPCHPVFLRRSSLPFEMAVMIRIRRSVLLGLLALLVAACASLPLQELSDARQALDSAREVGAERKAPEAMAEAERWMRAADEALEEGFYRRARVHAQRAKEAAIRAREAALQRGGGAARGEE